MPETPVIRAILEGQAARTVLESLVIECPCCHKQAVAVVTPKGRRYHSCASCGIDIRK